jgi:hypothetical protein
MKYNQFKTRGQAALEFMMTYGWAMLLLTALVAGLVYVIPHPKTLTANKCIFGSAIPCLGARLSANNLTIVLNNGMGQSIYNISANELMPAKIPCEVSNTSIRTEEKLIIICNNTNLTTGVGMTNRMNVSDDSRIRIELKYQKIKGGYNQSIIGELYAKYNE